PGGRGGVGTGAAAGRATADSRNVPPTTRTATSATTPIALSTAISDTPRPKRLAQRRPRTRARAVAKSTARVVALIPPAVEPGQPPIVISTTVRKSVAVVVCA